MKSDYSRYFIFIYQLKQLYTITFDHHLECTQIRIIKTSGTFLMKSEIEDRLHTHTH